MQTGDLSEYIEESRIPISLLVVLMGQFCLLLIDRVVYLTRSLAAKFVLQVLVVLGVLLAIRWAWHLLVLPCGLDRIYPLIKPLVDRPQNNTVIYLAGVHAYAFYYLPLVLHTHSAGGGVRGPIMLWYLGKAVYMYASGLQVRHGYPRYLLKNFFTKSVGACECGSFSCFSCYLTPPFRDCVLNHITEAAKEWHD